MNEFREGQIVLWWPGNTDYPSVVELIERSDENETVWIVNYPRDMADWDWSVSESELKIPEPNSPYMKGYI